MWTRLLIALIRAYQLLLSPLLGPVCRFEPSCSRYAIQVLEQHGAMRGLWLTLRRLGRCHPFHPGGYDPPPEPHRATSAPPLEPRAITASEPRIGVRDEPRNLPARPVKRCLDSEGVGEPPQVDCRSASLGKPHAFADSVAKTAQREARE